MTTKDFIDLLAARELAPASVLRQLRAKVDQGDHRVTSDSILKFLVKKELITRAQAKQLLETTLEVSEKAESSILGDAVRRTAPPPPPTAQPASEDFALAPLDDDETPVPLKPLPKEPAPAAEPTRPRGRQASPFDDDAPAAVVQPLAALEAAAESAPPKIARLGRGAGKKSAQSKRGPKRRGKDQWDSPLLLLGGGGLVVLLVAGVVLWYLMFREGADKVLAKANALFNAGSYQPAIEQYQTFVDKFSGHKDYSQAKVRLHLSRAWQAVEGGLDPAEGLAAIQAALPEIEDEPAFLSDGQKSEDGLSEAKRQLSALLTRTAKSLADKAEAAADDAEIKDRVAQLETALALTANSKYVPEQFRNAAELTAAREALARVQKRLTRDAALASVLEAMDKSIAAGDTAGAFAARAALLTDFPMLDEEARLQDKVREAAAAAQQRVKFTPDDVPAATDPVKSPVIAELTLAERLGDAPAASGAEGPVVVTIDGSLYALDAGSGALLWRRRVGAAPGVWPVAVPGGAIVAIDAATRSVISLDAATGNLRWRLPLDDKLTTPVALGERVLVGGESGKLFILDAATGRLGGHVDLPQPIRTAPAVSDRGDRVYVVADQSIVVSLAAEDMSCLGVYYLGHAAGSVAVPPLAVLNKLVVAENAGVDACRLNVLALDGQGAVENSVAAAALKGLIVTPLARAGRRFAAVTSRGVDAVYEISGASDAKSLAALAARESQTEEPVARYGLFHDGKLWAAGEQLTKLTVLPTGNQLSVEGLENSHQGDVFDHPLQAVGPAIIHVRRPQGRAGAIVAATLAGPGRTAWQTALAAPLAGAPAVDATRVRISAATAAGAVFLLERDALARGVLDRAVRAADAGSDASPPFAACVDLGDGRLVVGAPGSPRLLHFTPDAPRDPVAALPLPGPLSCPPLAWGDGFAAPTDVGQTLLFAAANGAKRGVAFQPELRPNHVYHWLRPAVAGQGEQSVLLLSDGAEKLYAVQIKTEPTPHLEAVAEADVRTELETPLAVVDQRVAAGTTAGELAAFDLPDLKPADPVKLGGRVVWGPFATPAGFLLATDANALMLVDPTGAVAWSRPLERGPMAGEPLVADGAASVLHRYGALVRITLADGAEASVVELGQPVVAGPTPLGERLLVATPDGALLVVNR